MPAPVPFKQNATHYEVLGVAQTATEEEIKKAYKKLCVQVHPDKHVAEDRPQAEANFKRLGEAYAVLSDDAQRNAYDAELREKLNPRPQTPPRTASYENTNHRSYTQPRSRAQSQQPPRSDRDEKVNSNSHSGYRARSEKPTVNRSHPYARPKVFRFVRPENPEPKPQTQPSTNYARSYNRFSYATTNHSVRQQPQEFDILTYLIIDAMIRQRHAQMIHVYRHVPASNPVLRQTAVNKVNIDFTRSMSSFLLFTAIMAHQFNHVETPSYRKGPR